MCAQVFVSAGRPANESQRKFRDGVINAIRLAGLTPRLMTDPEWDYRNPLRGIRQIMDQCVGAAIVAYPRYSVVSGRELREEGEKSIDGVAFPTAWNQIEAALAFERGYPLMVVAQHGLRQDAIFEKTKDVNPIWSDLDEAIESSTEIASHLRGWKLDIEDFVKRQELARSAASSSVSLSRLVSELKWHEFLALAATVIGALTAAATFGYRIGAGQWPLG